MAGSNRVSFSVDEILGISSTSQKIRASPGCLSKVANHRIILNLGFRLLFIPPCNHHFLWRTFDGRRSARISGEILSLVDQSRMIPFTIIRIFSCQRVRPILGIRSQCVIPFKQTRCCSIVCMILTTTGVVRCQPLLTPCFVVSTTAR